MFQILPLLLLFIPMSVRVQWTSGSGDEIAISTDEFSDQVDQCMTGGREARMRFELRICRRRKGWFAACESARIETRSIQYDPITESYKVITDRHDDENEPVSIGIPGKKEAFQVASKADAMSINFLARKDLSLEEREKSYLSARVLFECKGLMSKTFARISNVLTLGLVDIGPDDTGWKEFGLEHPSQIVNKAG